MATISKKSIAMRAGAVIIITIIMAVLAFVLGFGGQEPSGTSILDPTLAQGAVEEPR